MCRKVCPSRDRIDVHEADFILAPYRCFEHEACIDGQLLAELRGASTCIAMAPSAGHRRVRGSLIRCSSGVPSGVRRSPCNRTRRREPLLERNCSRRLPQHAFARMIRVAIVALVSWPLVLVAMLTQERVATPLPPATVTFFLSFVFAKATLLILFGRMLSKTAQ